MSTDQGEPFAIPQTFSWTPCENTGGALPPHYFLPRDFLWDAERVLYFLMRPRCPLISRIVRDPASFLLSPSAFTLALHFSFTLSRGPPPVPFFTPDPALVLACAPHFPVLSRHPPFSPPLSISSICDPPPLHLRLCVLSFSIFPCLRSLPRPTRISTLGPQFQQTPADFLFGPLSHSPTLAQSVDHFSGFPFFFVNRYGHVLASPSPKTPATSFFSSLPPGRRP